jgi:Ca-activated chloride channel family protein
MAGTLLTIAKDVKIQLEFNPASVESYRLVGYENRTLKDEDFTNDTVDAGELGAGHRVTAVYEVTPADAAAEASSDLKYQKQETVINDEYRNEITEIRLRYKEPDGAESKEIRQAVSFENTPVNGSDLSADFYFAAAVAEFGMLARNSQYKGDAALESVLGLAEQGLGEDVGGYRSEFIDLVKQYQDLTTNGWYEQ